VVVMAAAAVMFGGVALVRADSFPASSGAWLGAGALAILCSVVAITCLLAGLAIIGPVKTSAISLVEPVSTIAVGGLFLNERLSSWQWVGGALILVGAGLAIQRPATSGPPRGASEPAGS